MFKIRFWFFGASFNWESAISSFIRSFIIRSLKLKIWKKKKKLVFDRCWYFLAFSVCTNKFSHLLNFYDRNNFLGKEKKRKENQEKQVNPVLKISPTSELDNVFLAFLLILRLKSFFCNFFVILKAEQKFKDKISIKCCLRGKMLHRK